MHKVLFFIFIASLIVILPQLASAEEIPKQLKNEIRLWTNNQADNEDFLNVLFELYRVGFLGSGPAHAYSLMNTYYLPSYGGTQFVQIDGRTPNVGQTNSITIIVTRPDESRLELSIPVLESGAYSTTMLIDHDSPLGKYRVAAYHGTKQINSSEFYLEKSNTTPVWIKNVARWWIENKISDKEFLDGLDYLIKNNVIVTWEVEDHSSEDTLNVTIEGQKAVRRGTTQNLDIHVENSQGNVDSATVFIRVEDYGENVLKEFKGVTSPDGNYSVSWELSTDYTDIETFLVYVDVTDGILSETKVFTFQVYCLCGEPSCKCRN